MDRNFPASGALDAPAIPAGRFTLATLDRANLYAAAGLVALTAASFLGSVYWLLELLSHFRLQFAIGAMAVALWALLRRRPATAVLAAVVTAANLGPVLPYFLPGAAAAQASQQQVRVMAANVHLHNTNYTKMREAIREENPDIIGFLEVDQAWIDEISDALPEHPYTVLRPEEGAYGLALFSRIPLQEIPASPYVEDGVQTAIAVELELQSSPTTLVLAHLKAPTMAGKAALRNTQIDNIVAALASDSNDEQILIGDLNITPWSPKYAPLEKDAGLVNAARGRGYVATWPTWLPGSFLGIPIDHCLVSAGLRVQQFRAGRDIGSDHLPIVADIALAGPLLEEAI